MSTLTAAEQQEVAAFSAKLTAAHKLFTGQESASGDPASNPDNHLRLFIDELRERKGLPPLVESPLAQPRPSTPRSSSTGRVHAQEPSSAARVAVANAVPAATAAGSAGTWSWLPFAKLDGGEAVERQIVKLRARLREIDELLNDGVDSAGRQKLPGGVAKRSWQEEGGRELEFNTGYKNA